VDVEAIRRSLPVGNVTARVIKGGLGAGGPEADDAETIASAATAVRIETG